MLCKCKGGKKGGKKAVALFVALFAFAAFAAAPTNITSANVENLGIIQTISSAAAYDTVVATDSITLTSNLTLPEGGEAIIIRDAITGGGSDSVALQVMVDVLDGSGNFIYRTIADTMSAAAGEAIAIPTNAQGGKLRVKLVGMAANGGVVILNRIYVAGRRITDWERAWK